MTYDWRTHEPIEDYIHEIRELKKEIYKMQEEIEYLKLLVIFWKGKVKVKGVLSDEKKSWYVELRDYLSRL